MTSVQIIGSSFASWRTFSCKQRGLCPSCGTRRMCDEAASITDGILPNAPVRQWVLSLPFEQLRGLAATKPDVLTALGRIFAEEIARATKRLAGVAQSNADSRCPTLAGTTSPSTQTRWKAIRGIAYRLAEATSGTLRTWTGSTVGRRVYGAVGRRSASSFSG